MGSEMCIRDRGYGPDEIRGVLADLPTDGDAGDLLKDALRRLASGV